MTASLFWGLGKVRCLVKLRRGGGWGEAHQVVQLRSPPAPGRPTNSPVAQDRGHNTGRDRDGGGRIVSHRAAWRGKDVETGASDSFQLG